MVLNALRLADVVEEEGEVDQGRILDLVQHRAVLEADRVRLGVDEVELTNCIKRMNISGIPMIEFMLHQAGQGVELGDEPAQDPHLVHPLERRVDSARLR
jgi:hypothetical protein